MTSKFISGEMHAEDLIDLIIEQAEKINQYEKYFEENSVEAIQNKMEPYGEALTKLLEEDCEGGKYRE